MSAKKKSGSIPPKTEDRPVQVNAISEDEPLNAVIARNAIRPSIGAACSIQKFSRHMGDLEMRGLVDALAAEAEKSNKGDLSRAEAMLTTQAHTLDAIFNRLAMLGAANMGEYLDSADKYMRLALKAQSQCRATLETLAQIKNPPIVYAKQANIANGPQQVNNGVYPRTRENENEQSKQSGVTNELLPDGTASQTQGGINPALETLGEVHGAKVKRGESKGIAERLQGRASRHHAKGGGTVKAVR